MPSRSSRLAVPALCLLCVLLSGCQLFAQPPATPQPGPSEPNVVYGVAEGENLVMDIYRCPTPGPHPALMMIHGGGWAGGDKAGDRGGALNLSTKAGIVCFSINYRLAPKFKYPAQVLDCARAVRWVRAHAQEYDVDPARIGAWGGSAGGHLSLMLGVIKPDEFQTPDDPNKALSAKVQCVVDFFGPSDLSGTPVISAGAAAIVVNWIGAQPQDAPDKYADASPITHVTKDAAPVIFLHGDADALVPLEQSVVMKAALDKVGVANELVVVKNGGHGFPGATQADIGAAYARALAWLTEHLKPLLPAK